MAGKKARKPGWRCTVCKTFYPKTRGAPRNGEPLQPCCLGGRIARYNKPNNDEDRTMELMWKCASCGGSDIEEGAACCDDPKPYKYPRSLTKGAPASKPKPKLAEAPVLPPTPSLCRSLYRHKSGAELTLDDVIEVLAFHQADTWDEEVGLRLLSAAVESASQIVQAKTTAVDPGDVDTDYVQEHFSADTMRDLIEACLRPGDRHRDVVLAALNAAIQSGDVGVRKTVTAATEE